MTLGAHLFKSITVNMSSMPKVKLVLRCLICTDREFNMRWQIERHILELHSPFGFKFNMCKKIFERRTPKHSQCPSGNSNQLLINKQTGQTGTGIREDYLKCKAEEIEKHIQPV